MIKDQGVYIAHCPESNTDIASGIAPIRRYLDMGLHVGLGTDVAGGFSLSMFRCHRRHHPGIQAPLEINGPEPGSCHSGRGLLHGHHRRRFLLRKSRKLRERLRIRRYDPGRPQHPPPPKSPPVIDWSDWSTCPMTGIWSERYVQGRKVI